MDQGSPAAQVSDGRENVEDERQRGDIHRKPLTFRTLQPKTQDPLRRAKGQRAGGSNMELTNTRGATRTGTVQYPSLQDGKDREPHHHADSGQQVAPHVQRLVVDLKQTEDVGTPRLAYDTVPRLDEPFPEQRGDVHVSHGGGQVQQWEGGKAQ